MINFFIFLYRLYKRKLFNFLKTYEDSLLYVLGGFFIISYIFMKILEVWELDFWYIKSILITICICIYIIYCIYFHFKQ